MRLPSAHPVTAPDTLPCSCAGRESTHTTASCSPGFRATWPQTSSGAWVSRWPQQSLISREFCQARSTQRRILQGISVGMQSVLDSNLLHGAECLLFTSCSNGAMRERRRLWLLGWRTMAEKAMQAWTSDMFFDVSCWKLTCRAFQGVACLGFWSRQISCHNIVEGSIEGWGSCSKPPSREWGGHQTDSLPDKIRLSLGLL